MEKNIEEIAGDMLVTSERFFAAASLGPFGGLLGGFNENRLVADFEKAADDKQGEILAREFSPPKKRPGQRARPFSIRDDGAT